MMRIVANNIHYGNSRYINGSHCLNDDNDGHASLKTKTGHDDLTHVAQSHAATQMIASERMAQCVVPRVGSEVDLMILTTING